MALNEKLNLWQHHSFTMEPEFSQASDAQIGGPIGPCGHQLWYSSVGWATLSASCGTRFHLSSHGGQVSGTQGCRRQGEILNRVGLRNLPLPSRHQTPLPTRPGEGKVWDKRAPNPVGSKMGVGTLGVV